MDHIKKSQFSRLALLACLFFAITACATPFKRVKASKKLVYRDTLPSLKLAILPMEGKTEGAKFLRFALHASLMDSELSIMEKFIVDGTLEKKRWSEPEKFLAIPPQKLGEALGADALLYGKVTKWSKFYAIIYSTLVVGLELRLVDARTGELLWTSEQLDREFEGLLKIPTGIFSAVFSPMIFVAKNQNLNNLANKLVRNITESLRRPDAIKEEDKMEKKIVIASASEYIAKFEKNSINNLVNKEKLSHKIVASVDKTQSLPSTVFGYTFPSKAIKKINLVSLKKEKDQRKSLKLPKLQYPSIPEKYEKIYTIQVGAFQGKNLAKDLIKKLQQKGHGAFIALARFGQKLWYRVQVDRFKDKKEAVLYAKKLYQIEKLSYFIITTKVLAPAG